MQQHEKISFIILAGGAGKRLWPLSRADNPKQFLCINDKKTLLDLTISRIKNNFDAKIYVTCNKEHEDKVKTVVENNITIFSEPKSCNTAAAMLFSVMQIKEEDEIVIFVPADHYIEQEEKFKTAIYQAITLAKNTDSLVLLGVKPTFASTNYGYISYCADAVKSFHEKPTAEQAKLYIEQQNVLWNSGILIGKISSFINTYQQVAPEFFDRMKNYLADKANYEFENISTDYLILEKLNNLKVVVSDFVWSDLGSLDLFLAAKKDVGTKVVEVGAKNNIVDIKKKLIVLIGVENLCIVETDDVFLISNKQEVQKVNSVVDNLHKNNLSEFC